MIREPGERRRIVHAATVILCSGACLSPSPSALASVEALPGVSWEADRLGYAHPSSIRYSEAERLFYVADTGNRRIVLLKENLEPEGVLTLTRFGLSPYCALPTGDGSVWVSDLDRHDLFRIDPRQSSVDTLRLGADAMPGRMNWSSRRELSLIDRGARTVLLFQAMEAGDLPVAVETLRVPAQGVLEDLCFAHDGALLVVAATEAPFWLRSPATGRWDSWGSHGERSEDYSFPCGVAASAEGSFWVVDAFRQEIRLVGPDGSVLDSMTEAGVQAGQLFFPVGVAVDREGHTAVLERGGCRVQRFRRQP